MIDKGMTNDENTSELMAGIRYWFRDVGNKQLFRATLYEPDGISEWSAMGSVSYEEWKAGKEQESVEKSRAWQSKERIINDTAIGVYVNPTTKQEIRTKKALIIYSNSGTHIVPRKD